MIYTDPQAAAPAFAARIAQAQRILLLTHINPDGDAIGSLLGAAHMLYALGKTPICLLASPAPSYSLGLPGAEWLRVYQRGELLPEADLIWMLDTAAPDRVGLIAEEHAEAFTARPLLIVDHHVTNDGLGELNLIDPTAASTADLLFRLLRALQWPITPDAATCLYMGLITDTQSFQTSSTRPQTLHTAAEILLAGADRRAVVTAIYFSLPATTLRLTGLVLSELYQEEGLVWAHVTQAQLAASGAGDEATDYVVSQLQRTTGMQICALFKERHDGTVKLSLRSQPGINVAAIAQRWGGGGHAQAAGATLALDLRGAEALIIPLLRQLLT